jgi:transposase
MIEFRLDRRSGVPGHRQIIDQVRHAIHLGILQPGDQLPTVREVDEVSYRKGHRYLTVIADHDQQGRAVWAHEGKNAETLMAFYDELGPERVAQLEAISLDMGLAFEKATNEKAPYVRQCVDPFHLIKMANEAIDRARRWSWNEERRRTPPPRPRGRPRNDEPARARDEPRWVKQPVGRC